MNNDQADMQQLGMRLPSSHTSYMTARVYLESRGRKIKRTGRWFEVSHGNMVDVVCDWTGVIDLAERLQSREGKQ